MPDRRLELHEILCGILGSRNVYYQPPESVRMNYPAIVYELDDIKSLYANSGVYLFKHIYQIALIDKDSDSVFVDKLAALLTCKFVRHYKTENLNHWVFNLHY